MDSSSNEADNNYRILHLVRHAQGIHNVEVERNREALLSLDLLDAELSSLGFQQVGERHAEVQDNGLINRIELVVTSPMLRTMQTAVGIFGEKCHLDKTGSPSEAGEDPNADDFETSSLNHPPILALELCRERIGLYPCDKRGSITKYQSLFPMIDFSLIESEQDELWQAERREELEEVAERGMEFLKWVWRREEKEIAVVSHGIFLQQTLIAMGDNLDPTDNTELCNRFGNCELRSVIIYQSGMGSGSPTDYYCRKFPGDKKQ